MINNYYEKKRFALSLSTAELNVSKLTRIISMTTLRKSLFTFVYMLAVLMQTLALAQTKENTANKTGDEESQLTLNLQDVDIRVLINTVAR